MLAYPKVSIAPMMDCTDRHYRYLARLISQKVLLYTEMVTTGAILHGNKSKLLDYHPAEHPLALQLGGSNPRDLALCAVIAEDYGYDEINLNVGCPSDRVQAGRFGACLMKEPKLVAECISAMRQAVNIPVTVKTRTGVDEHDSYQALVDFVGLVSEAGCATFIVHARKAWLKGLSPRENREIPPLNYELVYRLKQDLPELVIGINGGIKTISQVKGHLQQVDSVMIGREAYSNPGLLATLDQEFFAVSVTPRSIHECVLAYIPYVAAELKKGTQLRHLIRHLVGLFHGIPGASQWRRHLSMHAGDKERGEQVIQAGLQLVSAVPAERHNS
jgi:tRNA-dihydrouridine synthase A